MLQYVLGNNFDAVISITNQEQNTEHDSYFVAFYLVVNLI